MKPARREAYFSCLKSTVEHSINSIELLYKPVFLLSGRYTNLGRKVSTEYAFNDLENYPEQYFVHMTGNVSGSVALEIGSRSDRGNPYVRSKSSGGYTEWKKLITSADLNGISVGKQDDRKRTNMIITTPSGLIFQLLFSDTGAIYIEKNSGSGWENTKQIYP